MNLRDDLPSSITSDRLTLRPVTEADLPDFVALANNWNVIEPTAAMPFPYLEEHGRAFLADASANAQQHPYGLENEAGAFIGVLGLKAVEDQPPELGYWLGEPHWGRGYATEAVRAVLGAVAQCGIKRITARVLQSNPASQRVLESCGFDVLEQTLSVVERHRGRPLVILQWSAP